MEEFFLLLCDSEKTLGVAILGKKGHTNCR